MASKTATVLRSLLAEISPAWLKQVRMGGLLWRRRVRPHRNRRAAGADTSRGADNVRRGR